MSKLKIVQNSFENVPISVWAVGLTFVTIINMCAVVGIGVMRYLSKSVYNQVSLPWMVFFWN